MKILKNPSLLLRAIYAVCLTAASYNHAYIVFAYGLQWDYGGLPLFVSIFWTALTFIDPLAAFLLLAKPKAGLGLTAAIIVSDVAINAWVGANYGFHWPPFLAQSLFLVFVLATIRTAWIRLPAPYRAPVPSPLG
ncbi:hypothetical protein [Undibacterium terreum]|uniref:Uncharacterized protein n=1 Tax=Undibacterium terreum TaxID=1224302 RepID=A0A916UB59_9BURK|nr:hypothetical protein [Undibacterium terreum]GGC65332.1 hypothetical protein GCM10011396_10400 [Undibacterium terreum]